LKGILATSPTSGTRARTLWSRASDRARHLLTSSIYFARTGYWHNGERVNPDFPSENFSNHKKVYLFFSQLASNKIVLDVGCGTGYGTAILAEHAAQVIGIDNSKSAIRFAKRRYPKVDFRQMNAQQLRFPDGFFDLIFSSENFEHLPDQASHLRELRRVLKKDGLCFIATPNPEAFAGNKQNPFHSKENTYQELIELFRPVFKDFLIVENSLSGKVDRGLTPRAPMVIFGHVLDTTYLSNTHSFFCFLH
jgi:SAM-dependent methyltransferase